MPFHVWGVGTRINVYSTESVLSVFISIITSSCVYGMLFLHHNNNMNTVCIMIVCMVVQFVSFYRLPNSIDLLQH